MVFKTRVLGAGLLFLGAVNLARAEFSCNPDLFAQIAKTPVGVAHDAKAVDALAAEQSKAQNWKDWKEAFGSAQKKFSSFDHAYKGEKVSGDVFHFSKADNGNMVMVLGDANGHGPKAAVDSVIMQQILHDPEMLPLMREGNTAKITEKANQLFSKRQQTTNWMPVVTINYNPVTGDLAMTGAGAPQLLLRRADGSLHLLHSPDLPIGIDADMGFQSLHYKLQKGDMLAVMTDGLMEGLVRDRPQNHEHGQVFYSYLTSLAKGNEVNHVLELHPPEGLKNAQDPRGFLGAIRRIVNPASDDVTGFVFQQ